jgi:hypothetical protein
MGNETYKVLSPRSEYIDEDVCTIDHVTPINRAVSISVAQGVSGGFSRN